MWFLIAISRGVYEWGWLDEVMAKIRNAGGKALLVCYGTPGWEEPSWPRIPDWTGPPAIPIMRPEWVADWQDFLAALSQRYPEAEFNIATETTLPALWCDPEAPERSGGAQRYVDLVLSPASAILRPRSVRIVAPGTTMRSEDWNTALQHVGIFLQHSDLFDALDLHIYRDSGPETVAVMQRLLAILDGQNLEITETGFAGNDTDQAHAWSTVWDFLTYSRGSERIPRAYGYQWWSGPAGLLRDDGSLRPAAEELKRRLQL